MIGKSLKKVMVIAMAAAMMAGGNIPANVKAEEPFNDASKDSGWSAWKNNWNAYSGDYEKVSLTPGSDQTQLNLGWYSKTKETPKVRVSTKQNMSGATTFSGSQTTAVVIDSKQYYSNKVVAKNFKENTTYYYQVFKNGKWQTAQKYKTNSFSQYSFLYLGDPQIGASRTQTNSEGDTLNGANSITTSANDNLGARNDSYNWNKILNNAAADHKNLSFILSAGDQINYSHSEREYAAYLGPDLLKSMPVATTIGSHDLSSAQYSMHFNNPNAFSDSQTQYTKGKTAAGTDYYYRYGNTLFLMLDTNNYNCATHENVIKKAINENKDARWRVVTFHQDIYGSGAVHSDADGLILRTALTPLMDKYDIDVVLQGHDHTYSRTYQLQGDGKAHKIYDTSNWTDDSKEFHAQKNCYEIVDKTKSGTVVDPKGTVYFEANSATGSKYYDLIKTQQDYISERSQSLSPTYAVVKVTDTDFSVATYDAYTRKQLKNSTTYTVRKTKKRQSVSAKSFYKKYRNSLAFKLNAKTNGGGKLTYSSSNSKIVSVNASGQVTIKGTGKAIVTVKAGATSSYNEAVKRITVVVAPKKQSVSVGRPKKKQLKITWKKDSKATGYQVRISRNKNFKGSTTKNYNIKSYKTYKKTISKLKSKKYYYVKVRSYKTVNKTKYYGTYSATKKVKVK